MKLFQLVYKETCGVPESELIALGHDLEHTIHVAHEARNQGYETPYASLNVPFDADMRSQIKKVVAQKKARNPRALVLIGIGGSNLGALAVHQALYGSFYNEETDGIKFYCAETVDPDYMGRLDAIIARELHAGDIIVNVVSKSGSTTETIANFELVLARLQEERPDTWRECVVVTTDEGSKLWHYAQQEKITALAIPKHVGGRYSVFSAVGLFPLALLGVDIDALCAGAAAMVEACVSTDFERNPAAIGASILAHRYRNDYVMHDTFLFSVALEGVGKWYRQLLAESIGKAYDVDGKPVFVGITPTVSLGTTDLHSMAQLYLGGPFNRFTTFISLEEYAHNVLLPNMPAFDALVPDIQGKSLASLLHAVLEGVQSAYQAHGRPFMSIQLPRITPEYIGQLLQYAMMQTMYLGALLRVNPFDQPQVELYKDETRKALKHG